MLRISVFTDMMPANIQYTTVIENVRVIAMTQNQMAANSGSVPMGI